MEIPAINRVDFIYYSPVKSLYDFSVKTSTDNDIPYTYILQSSVDNTVYKIGRTRNLRERVYSLNRDAKYKRYKLKPIAFLPYDREQQILNALRWSGAKTLYGSPSSRKAPEAFYLRQEDIVFVIDLFKFRRIHDENIPGEISLTRKEYRDSLNRICKVEYKEEIQYNGTSD